MVFGVGKSFILGVWLVAVGSTAALLWHQDRFFATSGLPFARISTTTKDVTYRSEDDIRWKPISGSGQSIFDGDKLATGPASSAIVDFGDGRAANLGAETSVAMSTIRQSSGLTYIISLSKGSVAVQKVKISNPKIKSAFPIIIRSGGRDYQIEPGQEKGISRDDKGVREFAGKHRPSKATPVASDNSSGAGVSDLKISAAVVEKLIQEVPSNLGAGAPDNAALLGSADGGNKIAPKVKVSEPKKNPPKLPALAATRPSVPEKAPAPAEMPKVAASQLELDFSSLGSEYFTFQSLSSVGGEIGILKWREPGNAKILAETQGWSPAVELKSGSNRKEVALPSTGQFTLKVEDFGTLAPAVERDGIPCASLELRGGSKTTQPGKKPMWSFGGEAREIVICSYREAVNKLPLLVSVSSLEAGTAKRPRIFKKPGVSGLGIQLVLTTPSQFSAILPILIASENFRVSTSQGMSQQGVFVSKSGKAIIQLAGPGLTANKADQIRAAFGADVVFKGSIKAPYDASGLSTEQFKEMVSNSATTGRKLYLLREGSLFPISRSFLEERKEVAAFIKSVSSQLFTEKVDIIAYK